MRHLAFSLLLLLLFFHTLKFRTLERHMHAGTASQISWQESYSGLVNHEVSELFSIEIT